MSEQARVEHRQHWSSRGVRLSGRSSLVLLPIALIMATLASVAVLLFDTADAQAASWTAIAAPVPSNAETSHGGVALPSVSCAAADACAAVGLYSLTPSTFQGLIETLTGGAWSAIEAPLPANGSSTSTWSGPGSDLPLSSVSCGSPGTCVAVGVYIDTSSRLQGLIETLSGGSWGGIEAPLPSNAAPGQPNTGNGLFKSVSCASASTCVAVGSYEDSSSNFEAVVDTLSGGTWSSLAVPLPSNANTNNSARLSSVSCAAPSACAAVGDYTDSSSHSDGLIETLSGNTWSPREAPVPVNANTNPARLTSVSCAAADACAAVGDYSDTSSKTQGLIETLSGGSWSGIEAPLPATATTTPNPHFASVSCGAAGTCSAVGEYVDASGQLSVIDNLSGGTWSAIEAPLPSDARASPSPALYSVSCILAQTCVAVGSYGTTSSFPAPLLETLSGTTWSATSAPLPSGGTSLNTFVAVPVGSCASDGTCVAVGSFYPNGQGLIESTTLATPFHISTTSLPNATRGVSYNVQLQAVGGATPYKWKRIGKLPKGLKLHPNGNLSGTPKLKDTPGNYAFTVQAQTHKSKGHPKQTTTKAFTLILQ